MCRYLESRLTTKLSGFSVLSPKPLCFDIKFLSKTKACIKLDSVNLDSKKISGCISLELKFMGFKIQDIRLGCFNIPFVDEDAIEAFAAVFKEMEERWAAAADKL